MSNSTMSGLGPWRVVPYLAVVLAVNGAARAETLDSTPHLRRPVALAIQDDRLIVANRSSGSLTLVDRDQRSVIGEYPLGKQLEDLALAPDGNHLLTVDSATKQLLLVDMRGQEPHITERFAVPGSPVTVRISADGSFCSVASLWAHRVTLIDIRKDKGQDTAALSLRGTIDLPFAPRLQWLSRDAKHLVVADSWGGKLAVIAPDTMQLRNVRSLEGHNIRGLSADADENELLVAHQMLNEAVPTTHDRIFWGAVMSNVVRSIPVADLLVDSKSDSLDNVSQVYDLARWSLYPLGRPGSATGDPGAVVLTGDGKAVLALSGVGEIAFRTAPLQPFFQRAVGRRPVAVIVDEAKNCAYVANMFDDSISVLDFESGEIVATIALGPLPELSMAEQGEIMFYDARFSLDGWYSCHSCHTDGHTNGLRNDNFSDDTVGAPKRILSLLGVGDTAPWAWSGAQESLQEQVRKSITITMRDHEARHATKEHLAALTAYLQTLPPAPPLLKARGEVDQQAAARGEQLFAAQGCTECHQPPTYTTPATYDVGLEDARGRREFNPPSLRGVSQRTALFHDNRAASLEDVLLKFGHGDADDLPAEDVKALLVFLRSL